jgi:very-short-patch-repair endonuclease
MGTIAEWIDEAGGVLRTRDLRRRGARDRDMTRAVRAGEVRRPRRGWYSTFSPKDPRFVAVQVGGRLTGAAALKQMGAWMWQRNPPVTVSVSRDASRLRRHRRARVVYDRDNIVARGNYWSVDPRDALARAIVEASFEEAAALWDWAQTIGQFDEADLLEVYGLLPRDARGIVSWSDARSQSFVESVTRVRLVLEGHRVDSQVPVGARQSIDLVVDDVVAIEVDGREFHESTFEEDRRKDLAILLEGRSPTRLSYRMIDRHWPRVLAAIQQAVANHRRGADCSGPWRRTERRLRARGKRRWRCLANSK